MSDVGVSILLPNGNILCRVGDMSRHVAGHVADTRKYRVGRVSKTTRHLTTCRGIPDMSVILWLLFELKHKKFILRYPYVWADLYLSVVIDINWVCRASSVSQRHAMSAKIWRHWHVSATCRRHNRLSLPQPTRSMSCLKCLCKSNARVNIGGVRQRLYTSPLGTSTGPASCESSCQNPLNSRLQNAN